jgi:hypothetical protein
MTRVGREHVQVHFDIQRLNDALVALFETSSVAKIRAFRPAESIPPPKVPIIPNESSRIEGLIP